MERSSALSGFSGLLCCCARHLVCYRRVNPAGPVFRLEMVLSLPMYQYYLGRFQEDQLNCWFRWIISLIGVLERERPMLLLRTLAALLYSVAPRRVEHSIQLWPLSVLRK